MTARPDINSFEIASLEDEIRVDSLCSEFLRQFHRDMLHDSDLTELEVGTLARGADYFLRDFVIADLRENLFRIDPQRIRQFAGNWYIVRNMEPNAGELLDILKGVSAFFAYCAGLGVVAEAHADEIAAHCRNIDYYNERIESFWSIAENGYPDWLAACPLESTNSNH